MDFLRMRMNWNRWWHGGDWTERAYRRAITLAFGLFLLILFIATCHWAALGG